MTKCYSTKRSLLTSVISLILCFAMLLGTTFAWFTDNVTSTNNKIVAGNLDVELYYQNDETSAWTEVDANTNVFKEETLWEPGHVEVVELKVVNKGSLAFKYMLDVNVVNEVESINVDGGELILSEHIKYGIIEGADLGLSRAEAIAAVNADAKPLKTAYSEEYELLPENNKDNENNYKEFTMVVYMPETVGNEANYAKGEAVPTIDLGINIFATQYSYEEDSFDANYDEKALYEKGKPVAKTKELTKATTLSVKDGDNYVEVLGKDLEIKLGSANGFGMDINADVVNLDAAYQFQPALTLDEAMLSEYQQWHADFVVSVDKNIPENSIALAGYYNAWCSLINNNKWVALANEGFDVKANEQIRLIKSMNESITVCLKDLAEYGNDGVGFLCGVMELNDALPSNTKFTVELRLYEATDPSLGSETGEDNYITVGTYEYLFK